MLNNLKKEWEYYYQINIFIRIKRLPYKRQLFFMQYEK